MSGSSASEQAAKRIVRKVGMAALYVALWLLVLFALLVLVLTMPGEAWA